MARSGRIIRPGGGLRITDKERRNPTLTGDGQRLKTCWQYFDPPRRLNRSALDSYVAQTKQQQAALETCRAYSPGDIEAGQGLFLFGPYGTGKTHLAIATVRNLMEHSPNLFGVRQRDAGIYDPAREEYRGLYCSFFSVVDLLDAMRPGSEAKQRYGDWLFHRAKADDLIVLDDIGAEKPTDWVAERLYAIVDIRYRMERANYFKLLRTAAKGQLGGRVVSRNPDDGRCSKWARSERKMA